MEGYCGIVCDNCKNYLKGAGCKGCRVEKELISDCGIKMCAIEKEIEFCFECEQFLCDRLIGFYEAVPIRIAGYLNSLKKRCKE